MRSCWWWHCNFNSKFLSAFQTFESIKPQLSRQSYKHVSGICNADLSYNILNRDSEKLENFIFAFDLTSEGSVSVRQLRASSPLKLGKNPKTDATQILSVSRALFSPRHQNTLLYTPNRYHSGKKTRVSELFFFIVSRRVFGICRSSRRHMEKLSAIYFYTIAKRKMSFYRSVSCERTRLRRKVELKVFSIFKPSSQ